MTRTFAALAMMTVTTLTASEVHAQQWNQQYQHGVQYGHQNTTNWDIRQGTQYQNPRAAAVGGILQGISNGLSNNPNNRTASAILGGIGQGLGQASGRTDFSQGFIQNTQQGYLNRFGQSMTSFNPGPNYGDHYGVNQPQPLFPPNRVNQPAQGGYLRTNVPQMNSRPQTFRNAYRR